MATRYTIKILLSWYRISDRQLEGDEIVANLGEQNILQLFDMPFWNHAYLCNAVEKTQQYKEIQKNIQHKIQKKKYCYFLEMFKLEEDALQSSAGGR